jgi:hypothetical protein
MADGVTVATGNNTSPPNSTKFATDDAGAAGHVPIVKLAYATDGVATLIPADVNGLQVQGDTTITGITASSATHASVNDTAASTQLIASNASRIGWSITNTSSAVLYVKFGSAATTTSFNKRLAQNADCGQGPLDGLYTGAIYGIWASDPGDGVAVCSEW